jgi:signal transduction histidine kinase
VSLKRTSLQTRIARHIAFAVVLSLVASALVLVVFRHRSVQRNMERSARTYTSLISEPLVTQIFFLDSFSKSILDQEIAQLRQLNTDVNRLEIVDVRGNVVLSSEGDTVLVYGDGVNAPVIEDRDLNRAIDGLEPSSAVVREMSGERVFRVVAPVVDQWGTHHFSLVGTFSYADVNRQLRNSLWLSALILALGLGLTQWVSVTLARGITRDVERLREGVQRIQEGHLEERVAVNSRDEIEELAEAFNVMADELLATIQRLREANRELETLDQTKADLVANVSHELKTPLTALRGYLELMTDGELGSLPDDALRAAMICRKNVQRLSLRVEELVQLSRFERFMALDSAREEVDLSAVLEGVIDTFRPRLEESEIEIELRVDPALDPLHLNPEQVERVFFNLLDNAVKFTPHGGWVKVIAEADVRDDRDGVLVSIRDNGVGIPRSELVRIFDRFYQVDPSSRRRFGGMGLGLSLVRSIVEAHRGSVWAESTEGSGSTIHVWFPRFDSSAVPTERMGPSDRLEGADFGERLSGEG